MPLRVPALSTDRLVVGRVRGVHGLRGLVRVEILTDRPEDRFAPGQVLHLEDSDSPLTVAVAGPVADGPGWRVGFREVLDRAAAQRLRDAYLEVDVDREAELGPDQAYWHEIVGVEVRGRGGRVLGTVAEVYRAGPGEVYVVRGGPIGEFDLPAVRSVIEVFAPRRGEIVVDEDALDLAAPPVDAPRPARRRPRWSRHGKGGAGASNAPAVETEPGTEPEAGS